MNATDDLSEPLGEGPIDTLTAIGRGAVLGILSAADEVLATKQLAERQARNLNAIRGLANAAKRHPRSQDFYEATLREIATIAGGLR